jgi:hypothetical protein
MALSSSSSNSSRSSEISDLKTAEGSLLFYNTLSCSVRSLKTIFSREQRSISGVVKSGSFA